MPDRSPAGPSSDGLPPSEQIEALCFDLDDTLIDARGAWRAGFSEAVAPAFANSPALQRLGAPAAVYEQVFRRYSEQAHRDAGSGEWDSAFTRSAFRRLLAEHDRADDELAEQLVDAYLEAWPRHIATFADAAATLEAARGRYQLALISNGSSREQRLKLDHCGLEPYFEVIVISAEAGALKPDPAIFEQTLSALDVAPAAAVHIGDSAHHDVRGARGAGLGAIWIDRGRGAPTDAASTPHARVECLAELRPLLGLARGSHVDADLEDCDRRAPAGGHG